MSGEQLARDPIVVQVSETMKSRGLAPSSVMMAVALELFVSVAVLPALRVPTD